MLQTMAYALSKIVPSVVLTGIVVSTCSVFQQDGVKGPSGAPSGNYSVAVLTNIPCLDSVQRDAAIGANQKRAVKEIQAEGFRHVWLAGEYYAQLFPLIQQGLQATITDPNGVTTYNLKGVEQDSQNRMTRLRVEVISV